MKMLKDHRWNNTEKSCQNTRRTGPSVTFWTTNLTRNDQWLSPGRSATTYGLTLGNGCDSSLLSNVPRHSAELCSAGPPVKCGFVLKMGMEFLAPVSWQWQRWRKYSLKNLSQCHLVHHRLVFELGQQGRKAATHPEPQHGIRSFKIV